MCCVPGDPLFWGELTLLRSTEGCPKKRPKRRPRPAPDELPEGPPQPLPNQAQKKPAKTRKRPQREAHFPDRRGRGWEGCREARAPIVFGTVGTLSLKIWERSSRPVLSGVAAQRGHSEGVAEEEKIKQKVADVTCEGRHGGSRVPWSDEINGFFESGAKRPGRRNG